MRIINWESDFSTPTKNLACFFAWALTILTPSHRGQGRSSAERPQVDRFQRFRLRDSSISNSFDSLLGNLTSWESYVPGSFSTPCIGDGKPPTFNDGILIMGSYKPLRTWVDEFIPYYMEIMGVDRPDRTYTFLQMVRYIGSTPMKPLKNGVL